jgi:hypothetical protein
MIRDTPITARLRAQHFPAAAQAVDFGQGTLLDLSMGID